MYIRQERESQSNGLITDIHSYKIRAENKEPISNLRI